MTDIISACMRKTFCILCGSFQIVLQYEDANIFSASSSHRSANAAGYRGERRASSVCLKKKKQNRKKKVKTLDEELVSRMDAAFKTKAPRAVITVSSIPCQVSEDCPIFSFN